MLLKSFTIMLASLAMTSTQTNDQTMGVVMLHTESGYPSGSTYVLKEVLKWLEQYNIRWIPIYMNEQKEILTKKLSKINGIFLTGGEEPLFIE